ncbi:hypothetical protein [Sphingobium sp. KCTC 72723]|uniref:hypothetical protein n=1 Tax=Sphingobium sp. KCTC 72723 TaxID=2733867 RepID=UPI00165E3D3D|nr:hypothetical protein [Sphingobium sp. KCTC 72723]
MKANPLGNAQAISSGGWSEQRMLEWCHENNRWAYDIGMRRWHYVQSGQDGKAANLQMVDGITADEVWTISRGKHLAYANWAPERLDKLERRCRWLIERGMPPEAFATLCARHGWATPRSAAA